MKQIIYEFVKGIAPYIPSSLKRLIRKYFSTIDYDIYLHGKSNPFKNEASEWLVNDYPVIGIIKELAHYHQHYIKACREMGISYKIIDISGNDWFDIINLCNCDAFLVWPSSMLSIWKDMFDERLNIIANEMGKLIYPSFNEIWLYENKRRVNYWLIANNIPHPKTGIFYNQQRALDFIEKSNYPLVLKTNTGASGSGVFIINNHREAKRYIKRAFKNGIVARRHNPNDRHWGYVFLQEFLDIKHEWRMVRIGDSYFGHPKGLNGKFHSGSGVALWDVPPIELLNFLKEITDRGNFTSMDVDIFETTDGRYLVNELQTVFGASVSVDQLRIEGKPGRYKFDSLNNQWMFEQGDFAKNACANARLDYLLNNLLPNEE